MIMGETSIGIVETVIHIFIKVKIFLEIFSFFLQKLFN